MQDSGVQKSAIFARRISPGANNEFPHQNVSFTYTWEWTKTPGDYICQDTEEIKSFNRFTFGDIYDAIRECQRVCDEKDGCNFISITPSFNPCQISSTCTYVPFQGSVVYRNPKQNFVQQPVLSWQIDPMTGQHVGVASFGIKPLARGVLRMIVTAVDTGETNELKGSISASAPVAIDFVIT